MGGAFKFFDQVKRAAKLATLSILHYPTFPPTYEVLKMKDSDVTRQNGESPSRCDQCVFSSPDIGILMKHLTTHLKETLNKCGHCEKKLLWFKCFEIAFENEPRKETAQMLSLWICLSPCREFEDSFEIAHRGKAAKV